MTSPLLNWEKLSKAVDWQSKYRIIMQLGKQLPALASVDKTEQHLVSGCESAAWLLINSKPTNLPLIAMQGWSKELSA